MRQVQGLYSRHATADGSLLHTADGIHITCRDSPDANDDVKLLHTADSDSRLATDESDLLHTADGNLLHTADGAPKEEARQLAHFVLVGGSFRRELLER